LRPAGSALGLGLLVAVAACGGTLDAGRDVPHGILPVDERNPVILHNDGWTDNWFGEYAILLAASGGPPLAGIVAVSSDYWPDANFNGARARGLVDAARASGLRGIPDVTTSAPTRLVRPANGQIESTVANGSAGAELIVNVSRRLGLPSRPVVVLAAAPLTDIAEAYFMDPSVVDRVVIVAALGWNVGDHANMSGPNGDLDPWAAWIVAQRFRYVQVSTWYDQTGDVPAADLPSLPRNPLGMFMTNKHPEIFDVLSASDQLIAMAVALPTFALTIQRAAPDVAAGFPGNEGPPLRPSDNGDDWFVTEVAAPLARARLWQMLLDPQTFAR
jgi:hypothetical protein